MVAVSQPFLSPIWMLDLLYLRLLVSCYSSSFQNIQNMLLLSGVSILWDVICFILWMQVCIILTKCVSDLNYVHHHSLFLCNHSQLTVPYQAIFKQTQLTQSEKLVNVLLQVLLVSFKSSFSMQQIASPFGSCVLLISVDILSPFSQQDGKVDK